MQTLYERTLPHVRLAKTKMIPELVNFINVSKNKNIPMKLRYSKYALAILKKLEELGYIKILELDRHIIFKAEVNKFNKCMYFKPYRLGYKLNQLIRIENKLNRLYNGIMLKNSSKGITTNTVTGGQIILYVY